MMRIGTGPWSFGEDPTADVSETATDHIPLLRIPRRLTVYWVKRGSTSAHSGLHVWYRQRLGIWWKVDVAEHIREGR